MIAAALRATERALALGAFCAGTGAIVFDATDLFARELVRGSWDVWHCAAGEPDWSRWSPGADWVLPMGDTSERFKLFRQSMAGLLFSSVPAEMMCRAWMAVDRNRRME